MTKPSHDPSIEGEPHLRGGGFRADPSEARAARKLRKRRPPTDEEKVDQSVWDEPGISPDLVGSVPNDALTYRAWLEKRRVETGLIRSWAITFAVALAAGPWAILGAFWGSGQTAFSILAIVAIGPVVEEMMKVAAALWIVERKPFLFLTSVQVLVCALAGALIFASIENVLYLHVYVQQVPAWLPYWRWTVCVGLHVGCSAIAGMGVMRVWREAMEHRTRPRIALAFPYLLTAAIVHGTYNSFAVVFSLVQHRL